MGQLNGLEGQKINHWTILEELGGGKIICQCDCVDATIKELYKKAVIEGRSKSCGCIRKSNGVNVGDHFNEWEVLEKLENRKVLCRCSCGTIKEVFEGSLKNGSSKSCGHKKEINNNRVRMVPVSLSSLQNNVVRSSTENIENQQFGDWIVVSKINKDKVICRCESCGTVKELYISNLKRNKSRSCGCKSSEYRKQSLDEAFNKKYKDKTYNFWTIIGKGSVPEKVTCRCICGNIKEVYTQALKNGASKSCGCKSVELHLKTMYETYGEIANNKENNRESWQIKAVLSKENLESYIKSLDHKPFLYELCELLDLQSARMGELIKRYGLKELINFEYNTSQGESELCNYIKEIYIGDIIRHCRDIIKPNELDIYLPELKIAIEFNGNYWHSSAKVDKEYHKNKTRMCKKQGIHLIHIFEYEWINNKNNIKRYLYSVISDNKTIIYGRDTYIKEIEPKEAYEFEDKFHLQKRAASTVNLGIYTNNKLCGVMTFGKPRFDNMYEYELIRLCFDSQVAIVGGSNKLFRYFIEKYSPSSIISYCNIAKFSGDIYLKLGFKYYCTTQQNYVWAHNNEVYTRYQTQKSKLIEKGLGTIEETEDEIMTRLGFIKIYDCGNDKYIYNKEEQ